MKLSKLAVCLKNSKIIYGDTDGAQAAENTEITGLSADSRTLESGDLFFCLTGGKIDSHAYAAEAVKRGAVAVVCERELPLDVPQILTDDSRAAMGEIAAAFYGYPAKKLKIIGVTGTNGKTTVSNMLASILHRAGKNTAVVGTLGIFYANKKIPPSLTTPDPIFLHRIFADMVKCGVEYVAEEVSAHALWYKKDAGISYEACIFTNFTQDHLDFFGNMQTYKQAKKKLFLKEVCPIAVLNGDDKTGREIGAERADSDKTGETKTLYYALDSPADTFAVITSEEIGSSEFMLNLSDALCRISLPMTGRHNIYNAMAAACAAYVLGIRLEAIAGGLKNLPPVAGRLQNLGRFRGANIFVDFAHTPDGLEKSLRALRPHCKGRLICVFGCGGNRDKGKRPLMGETVARRADYSVLTSDNPRYEEPLDIIGDIEKGYRRFSVKYAVIPDRRKATEYAVSLLRKGDVLLVAGKGGEEYQEIMGIKYPYNDNAVIKEAVKAASENTGENPL